MFSALVGKRNRKPPNLFCARINIINNEVYKMLAAEIKEMPVNERIILMEEIWDSLYHERKEIESPAWHKEVLDERITLINSGKANFISIQELRNINS